MTTHPAADAFPMMDQNRFQDLVDDIREHGQHEPITLCDGMILDGRNRYKACLELGINPKTKDFDGDPWAYVWSLNGERRDLVAEQRFIIWDYCNGQSAAWQAEKARIQAEANRKRSEAAKAQHEVSKPRAGEHKPVMVVEHSVLPPNPKNEPGKKAPAYFLDGCGVIVVQPDDSLKIIISAIKRHPFPMPETFVASLLRRAAKVNGG